MGRNILAGLMVCFSSNPALATHEIFTLSFQHADSEVILKSMQSWNLENYSGFPICMKRRDRHQLNTKIILNP
jgi:hypothetical protein